MAKPTPDEVQALINAAEKHFNKELKGAIEQARKYKKGDQWTPGNDTDADEYRSHQMVANMALPNTIAILSAIYSNRPIFFATANGPGMGHWERIAESINNFAVTSERYKLGSKCGMVIQDGIEAGIGWLEIGRKVVGRREIEVDGETKQIPKLDLFCDQVSSLFVFVDPDAGHDIDKATYIVKKYTMPLYQLKADKRFKKGLVDKIVGGEISKTTAAVSGNREVPDIFRRVSLYDVQIMDEQNVNVEWLITYCEESSNDYLREVRWPFPTEGFTLIPFINYINLDEFRPMGDIESVHDLQNAMNNVISKQSTHIDRAVTKVAVDKRYIDDEAEEALESSDMFRMIKLKNLKDKKLGEVLKEIDFSNISADHYNFKQELLDLMQIVTGINTMAMGAKEDTKRTATEIAEVSRGKDLRTKQKQDSLYNFFRRVGQVWLDFARDTYDDDQVIEIDGEVKELIDSMHQLQDTAGTWVTPEYNELEVGDTYEGPVLRQDGKKYWLTFKGVDIPEGLTIAIDPVSTQPKNREADRALFMAFMDRAQALESWLMNIANTGSMPLFKWAEIVEAMLEQFDMKDPDQYFDRSALEELLTRIKATQQAQAQAQMIPQQPGAQPTGQEGAQPGQEPDIFTSLMNTMQNTPSKPSQFDQLMQPLRA